MERNEPAPNWPPDQSQFTAVNESPQFYSFNLSVLVDDTDCLFKFSVYKRNMIQTSSDPNAEPGHGDSKSELSLPTTMSGGKVMESEGGDDVKQKLINLERDVAVDLDQD